MKNETELLVRGREKISHALGRSSKTMTRWAAAGILPVWRGGPFRNSPLICRRADIERLRQKFAIEESDDH
jgi:hypothetical protein